jgi:hypothetical protein
VTTEPAAEPVTEPAAPTSSSSSGTPATLEAALVELDRERREVADARKEAGDRRKREQALERELEKLRTQGLSESEKAIADAKRAGAEERDALWRDRYLREAVTAAAAGKLRDPDDAYGHLYGAGELDELAAVDPEKMREEARKRVDALLEAKPYLAVEPAVDPATAAAGALTSGVRGRLEPGATDSGDWLRDAARKRSTTIRR